MQAVVRLVAVALITAVTAGVPLVVAQVRPVYDRGAAGLALALQRLQTTASMLHTAAHPDDEDSALITRTARGDHARVAYLSLTRGEGGQNIIGTELFDALGVIRTEELLRARTLYGGQQFFTRAIDFGYSKVRAEAAAKWNERDVLDDIVRAIRAFRPLVIVSRWSTEATGHGHHQLAGYLTPLAFEAAGDPGEFPQHLAEGLGPWQPKKLYVTERGPSEPGLLAIPTGAFDPLLGRSYAEIAAEGRSQHKSQNMGDIEPRGDLRTYVRPVAGAAAAGETSMFDGLDTSVGGIAALAGLPAGALRAELDAIARLARQALDDYEPLEPARLVPALTAGLRATRAARQTLKAFPADARARADADFLLAAKEGEFTEALALASGLVIDALADTETVPQGSGAGVTVRAFVPPSSAVRVIDAGITAPQGWGVARADAAPEPDDDPDEPAQYAQEFSVSVPGDAPVTQPYFLATPRQGDRYVWATGAPKGASFEEGPLVAWVSAEVGGVPVTLRKRVDYRYADGVRGEIRRNLNVVPALTVGVDSPLLIVPTAGPASPYRITVTATSYTAPGSITGTVRLRLPAGWTSSPAQAAFELRRSGDRTSTAFIVSPPARRMPGRAEIVAEAVVGGVTFSRDVQTIAYPHIETHRIYRPATTTAQVLDLKVAPVRVGYVMGAGDQVPDALRRMGVAVTLLENETISSGDLSRFDTIVVGIRASEARPDFVNEHARLMQYVTRGGTLIVQYQQTDYLERNLPPYPVDLPEERTNSRVTDEQAPVTILAPDHPVFTFPNRITAADFDGWVQERNLYAFPVVDPRYRALLESVDPGEAPQRGGQVYAEVGKGRYVYTAYAWFRQLPAGVPGAYRQFANLISLSRAPR